MTVAPVIDVDPKAGEPEKVGPELDARMDEGAAVFSWLSPFKWLTEHEFEELAEKWRAEPAQVCRPGVFTSDTTFAALEVICLAGVAEARLRGGGRDGKPQYVEYRLVPRVKH